MLSESLASCIFRSLDAEADWAGPPELSSAVRSAFLRSDGEPDPVRCAELLVDGPMRAKQVLGQALAERVATHAVAQQMASHTVDELQGWQLLLTGAETVAVLLAAAGVTNVFVYAGTSELALCDAVDRVDGVRLVNGRGDKESAFMAAGASLLIPNQGAAILHGARGFTNAAGGVADARRNEAGTLYIVGVPSSASARFLPPHGEQDLLAGVDAFTDWLWQAPAAPDDPAERRQAARQYVARFRQALATTAHPPNRPAVFAIPQDVAERRSIAIDDLAAAPLGSHAAFDRSGLEAALRELRSAERPLFLVDDYALHYPTLRRALDEVSQATGGAVLQVRYRRGAMLFERLRSDEVANFLGWLNPFDPVHVGLLDACDLLVTVEDRNMYERVVGQLPTCRKVAINSDPPKVRKNEYLRPGDTLVAGDPGRILVELADRLSRTNGGPRPAWFPAGARTAGTATPEPASAQVEYGRRAVARALAEVLAGWSSPVLIDDSQMFGGLLSEHYDEFPPGLRVFGGHGGFVGGGLAYATGLAIARHDVRVMCTLGDQGFTNSFQGLVAAVEEQAQVLFLVCNNGESVSLKKQAAASYGEAARRYLLNVPDFAYHTVADAIGVPASQVAVPIGGLPYEIDVAVSQLSSALDKAAAVTGPSLVELVLPSLPEAWRGIWLTQGFEDSKAVAVG